MRHSLLEHGDDCAICARERFGERLAVVVLLAAFAVFAAYVLWGWPS